MKQIKYFSLLKQLYADMDEAWNKTASIYGFKCTGCSENCCESEFYHHTYIEKDFLLYGLKHLSDSAIKLAVKKARKVSSTRQSFANKGKPVRIMCPLNNDGLCSIYAYRPMICRLHGIPHELCRPGTQPVKNPGCDAGSPLFDKIYCKFDRTPFYLRMADIEINYRKNTGLTGRIKKSIADMLLE